MRTATAGVPLVTLAVAALATASCGDAPADARNLTTARSDSAGISIIVQSGEDRILSWSARRLWTFGGAQDDRLVATRLRRRDIAVHPEGNLVVLDATANRVSVLGTDGQVVRTFGRSGSGPGEISRPFGITVGPDGVVWVADRAKSAFVRWSSDGTVLPEIRIDHLLWGQNLRAGSDCVFYESREPTVDRPGQQKLRCMKGDSSVVLLAYDAPAANPGSYPSCPGYGVSAPPLFAPDFIWDGAGVLATSNGSGYRIDIVEGGHVTRSIRRAVDTVELDEGTAAREWGDTLRITRLGCEIPPEEIVRARGHAPTLPAIVDLTVDSEGQIWVRRDRLGPVDPIDILTTTGEYVGTRDGSFPFPAAVAESGAIFSLTEDSLGVPVVTAYRLVDG